MTPREVRDADDLTWSCMQAFAGLSGDAAEAAADLVESPDGTVPVVCTPTGGSRSLRLSLARDWAQALSDAELLAEIEKGKG